MLNTNSFIATGCNFALPSAGQFVLVASGLYKGIKVSSSYLVGQSASAWTASPLKSANSFDLFADKVLLFYYHI